MFAIQEMEEQLQTEVIDIGLWVENGKHSF